MNKISVYYDPEGDWSGLYINGKLVWQGHYPDISDVPWESFKIEFESHDADCSAEDVFPQNEVDVIRI